jgi:small subunit ribosomal protein S17|tara:strand:- start:110 stop:370 length:261 start_codon:yes stop_codon:yes gene_type:complete
MTSDNKKARTLEGKVVKNKMNKTAVVAVIRRVKHKIGKTITLTTRLKVHDDKNECGVGDRVLISECRPISKDKSWQLVSIVEKHRD